MLASNLSIGFKSPLFHKNKQQITIWPFKLHLKWEVLALKTPKTAGETWGLL